MVIIEINILDDILPRTYRLSHFSYFQYHGRTGNPAPVVNYRQVEKKILDEILSKKVYDTRLRPPGQNKSISSSATLVHVNIFVRDISAISDVGMVGRTI